MNPSWMSSLPCFPGVSFRFLSLLAFNVPKVHPLASGFGYLLWQLAFVKPPCSNFLVDSSAPCVPSRDPGVQAGTAPVVQAKWVGRCARRTFAPIVIRLRCSTDDPPAANVPTIPS